MKPAVALCIGIALSLAASGCNKHQDEHSGAGTPVANASAELASAAPADPAAPAPADSAAIPTEQDYEEQAAKTVTTAQSLDTQVNAIAKEIAGPSK